jgi:hypothetical protein
MTCARRSFGSVASPRSLRGIAPAPGRGRLASAPAGDQTVAHEVLEIRKRSLRAAQMLAEARAFADAITLAEMQFPAEPLEAVWHRIETKYGIPFGTMWSLRWRFSSLKDIWASLYSMLRDTHALIEGREAARIAHQHRIDDLIGRRDTD